MPVLKMYGLEITRDIIDRFWSKVNILSDEECWEWQAAISGTTGYGNFGIKYPKNTGAHRMAFLLANGYCPEKITIMHSCDNRKCCNPKHLSLGDHQSNMDDMVSKQRASQLGERSWNHKITEEIVKEIRNLRSSGLFYREIADIVGLSPQHVGGICRGLYWKHI